jgi:hypothetical protein
MEGAGNRFPFPKAAAASSRCMGAKSYRGMIPMRIGFDDDPDGRPSVLSFCMGGVSVVLMLLIANELCRLLVVIPQAVVLSRGAEHFGLVTN